VTRRLLGVLALALAACRSTPERTAPEKTAEPAPETSRALFERLRAQGGFTTDAHVVRSPIWPRKRDEVIVLYDLAAKGAPLAGAKALRFVLRPETGPAIERPMQRDGDIAIVRVPASELRPGRLRFIAGDRTDDNCGNPFGLPIVDLLPLWNTAESDHFVYKWMDGDPVGARVREVLVRLERRLKAVLGEARLTAPSDKITFLHYADRETGLAHQAQSGNNYDWSRNLVFSAEAEDDAHELTHLLFYRQVGRHVGLFDEGVAIHVGQEIATGSGWLEKKCDAWALDALADDRLPSLAGLLTPSEMYAQPWDVVGKVHYPAGCSFVGALLERHGIEKLKSFLSSYDCSSQHDAERVSAAFEKSFGVSLEAADRTWRRELTRPPR
jgi:hypothetical protein